MKEAVALQRIEKVREQMREQEVDALFLLKEEPVTDVDFIYLLGFTGSMGYAVITQEKAVLMVDSRYTEQARQQARGVDVVERKSMEQLLEELLPQAFGEAKRVGLMEEQLIFVKLHNDLTERFPDIEFVTVSDIARTGRITKNEDEIDRIRRSVRATEEALLHAFSVIKPGVTEREIAHAFRFALPAGSELSFPSIVISGERSVLVHGRPSNRRIQEGDTILFDVGCILPIDDGGDDDEGGGGLVSDLSRDIVCGTASAEQKRAYRAIVEAIKGSLKLYRPGIKASVAHEEAERILKSHGYADDEIMGHSLGHGIGLQGHEAPRVGPKRPSIPDLEFAVEQVVTVEPGIYSKRLGFGMRVELNIVIREDGPEILGELPWEEIFETDKLVLV